MKNTTYNWIIEVRRTYINKKALTYSSLKSLLEEKQKILHRLETIVQSPTMVALDAYKNRIQSKNHQIAKSRKHTSTLSKVSKMRHFRSTSPCGEHSH